MVVEDMLGCVLLVLLLLLLLLLSFMCLTRV